MERRWSVTPFMAETTTVTLDERAAERTRRVACTMRAAPRGELSANLKGRMLRRWLVSPSAQCARSCNAAGLASAADSSCTFPGCMACAPGLLFPVLPPERLWRGFKEETHRQVRFWRGVGNFLLVC